MRNDQRHHHVGKNRHLDEADVGTAHELEAGHHFAEKQACGNTACQTDENHSRQAGTGFIVFLVVH